MTAQSDRAQKIGTIAKWALGIAGAAIIAPIIFLAIKGLVGLAVAGIIGLSIVNFAPVLSMKFANWKVKGITAEAAENPIETLVNLLAAKREAFNLFRENVTAAAAARDNFKQKVEVFSKRYPERAAEFQVQLARMTEQVTKKKQALSEAQNQLDLGAQKLEEMRAYWEMTSALRDANKAAGMDTGDMYEKLKADTAVDAVLGSMNLAFAELEVAATLSVDQEPAAQEIAYNPSQPLNVGTLVGAKEKSK